MLILGNLLEGLFDLNQYFIEVLQFFIVLYFFLVHLRIECFDILFLLFEFSIEVRYKSFTISELFLTIF